MDFDLLPCATVHCSQAYCLPCVFHITCPACALFPSAECLLAAEQVGTFWHAEGGRQVLRGSAAGARRHHTLRILPKDLRSLPLLRRKVHGVP